MTTHHILILGATYGSLLAIKLLLAGHKVTLVCLLAEAELINQDGIRVRLPVKGRDELVEIQSRTLVSALSAIPPAQADPAQYDLIALAMQEPQYRSTGVRELMAAIADSRMPCISIMNMPPLPYLKRIPGLSTEPLARCYTDASVWDRFEPALMTLCSPDPQAFRPPDEPTNVLQVSLPTNFKAARFEADESTAILRQVQADIEAIRFRTGNEDIELPVKLKVHDSVFVPLAKWSMLLTGNYRCVQEDAMRSIKEAVHSDLQRSRSIYDWVSGLCRNLGASAQDQVPFEKYANAAMGLVKPSSAARALLNGATQIERVDLLVQSIAAQQGMQSDLIDEIVTRVDSWLKKNKRA